MERLDAPAERGFGWDGVETSSWSALRRNGSPSPIWPRMTEERCAPLETQVASRPTVRILLPPAESRANSQSLEAAARPGEGAIAMGSRAEVLGVRIHLPPAESHANRSSWYSLAIQDCGR